MNVPQAHSSGQGTARIDVAAAQASANLKQSPFHELWAAGYRRVVPITPHNAALWERSTLAKRPQSRGKAPGVRRPDGLWSGFDWLRHETTEADLDAWAAMGAGVGIRTGAQGDGTYLVGVDVDTFSPDYAGDIEAVIREMFGGVPRRIGNAPKALFLLRTSGPVPYACIEFDDGIPVIGRTGAKSSARVELLCDGRQFVASGIHPNTLTGYSWSKSLRRLENMAVVPPSSILEEGGGSASLMARLEAVLPKSKPVRVQGAAIDRGKVDQEKLKGDPELVRKAVEALPNTLALFPIYDDMIRVGAAICGALADHPGDARELFHHWSAKWEGGDYREDVTDGILASLKPPYAIGATWLYDQAEKHSGGLFTRAMVYYEPLNTPAGTPDADIWPEPLDMFGNADPGELAEPPAGSLPTVIEDWARSESRRKGVTMAFAAASAVTVCAAAIGASLKIRVREHDAGWHEPASLWVMLIAPPGTGKSPAIRAALQPLKAVDAERYQRAKPLLHAWDALQRKRKKTDEDAAMPRPVVPRIVVDDATMEKQIRIHAENPRGILRAPDEFVGLLGSLGAYKRGGETDRTNMLRMFDGDDIVVDRVGTGTTRVEHALMGILAGTQPDRIRALMRDLEADGLLQRMLPVLDDGTRRSGLDEPADETASRAYAAAVRHLAAAEHGRGAVAHLTAEAQRLLTEAREKVAQLGGSASLSAGCRGHLEKWGKLLPRLVLTFHCLDMIGGIFGAVDLSVPVQPATVRRAVDFGRFLIRHALAFYEAYGAPSEQTSEARWIAGHLLTKPDLRVVTRRDIYTARKNLQGAANRGTLLAAMRELEHLGWCRPQRREADGPIDWLINPAVHERFAKQARCEVETRREAQSRISEAARVRAEWLNR